MDDELLRTLAAWDGDGVVVRHDAPTGTWIFIALHDSTFGRPAGGTRMKVYPRPVDGLIDAQRLAEGMTYKWAGVGVEYGGGKAVLAIPRPLDAVEKEGLFRRYGDFVESLSGGFATGADLGAGPAVMEAIAQRTDWVVGTPRDGKSEDPGPFTARGVYCGLRAAVAHVFGSDEVAGRTILVEGLGGVGGPLARALAADGAELLLTDLDTAKAEAMAAELGGRAVPLDGAIEQPHDVYAPCAIGATLNADTIPRLAARIVAGSANNQLAEPADADRLHERGIVYAPDYVINAGGALAISVMEQGLVDRETLMAQVEAIGQTVGEILNEAAQGGIDPLSAARARVDRLLAKRRAERGLA